MRFIDFLIYVCCISGCVTLQFSISLTLPNFSGSSCGPSQSTKERGQPLEALDITPCFSTSMLLYQFCNSNDCLANPEHICFFFFFSSLGLAVLHALHICHLDVSLHNILVDRLGEDNEIILIWLVARLTAQQYLFSPFTLFSSVIYWQAYLSHCLSRSLLLFLRTLNISQRSLLYYLLSSFFFLFFSFRILVILECHSELLSILTTIDRTLYPSEASVGRDCTYHQNTFVFKNI